MHPFSHTYNLYSSLTVPPPVSTQYKTRQYRVLFVSFISFLNIRQLTKRYEPHSQQASQNSISFLISLQSKFIFYYSSQIAELANMCKVFQLADSLNAAAICSLVTRHKHVRPTCMFCVYLCTQLRVSTCL